MQKSFPCPLLTFKTLYLASSGGGGGKVLTNCAVTQVKRNIYSEDVSTLNTENTQNFDIYHGSWFYWSVKVLAEYSYESFSDNVDAKFHSFQSNWRHHPIIMKQYILVYMFLDFGWEFVRICAMIFTTINWRVPVSKSFICWVRHLIEKINLLLAFTTAEHFIQKM